MNIIRMILFMQFFTCIAFFGQTKQVCFSIDDLPVVNYGTKDTSLEFSIMKNLISSLTANNVPAIGFVNENKLFEKDSLISSQVNLLKMWLSSGLELGNHTFSHINYHTVTFTDYTENILKGEIITKKLLGEKNLKIKYFRHPFLRIGNTKAKADSLTDFLTEHGYTAAPVTIDNDDYLFARAYQKAKINNDAGLKAQIGNDYISYMENKLKYFENESEKLFNRNIRQILLIHASLLNSDYMDALIEMFKRNNYTFISMDEALKDDAYNSEITAYGDWGISWIDRWALSQGKRNNYFKDEPVTPGYIIESSK